MDTQNGQWKLAYPHSVSSASNIKWIDYIFIFDGGFSSLYLLEATSNVQNTKCTCLKQTLNRYQAYVILSG